MKKLRPADLRIILGYARGVYDILAAGWTVGASARDDKGDNVHPTQATSFDIIGAMQGVDDANGDMSWLSYSPILNWRMKVLCLMFIKMADIGDKFDGETIEQKLIHYNDNCGDVRHILGPLRLVIQKLEKDA